MVAGREVGSPVFDKFQKIHKNNPLMPDMLKIIDVLGVNRHQICDFDDAYGLHICFFRNGKKYSVAVQESD
jgi:hypothetical protein